mgnify:CR=1 FL=1
MDKINDSVNRTDRLNLKSNYLKSTRKEKYSLQPSASLTVESAFVFPFFFLAIVILVLFLDLYRIQSVIQASLSQSSRELGMYAANLTLNLLLSAQFPVPYASLMQKLSFPTH